MINFDKLRLPYRDDTAFSLLAFAVFIIPLAFSAYSYENFESVKFSLLLLCTGGALTAFIMAKKQTTIMVKYHKQLYILLGLFFLWAILSSIFSLDFVYSLIGFYYRYTSGLLFYAAFLVFFLLLMQSVNSERLGYLLKILALDAFVVAVIAFLQSFGWIFYSGLDTAAFVRGPSLLGNPDFSAMFLAVAIPIVVYLYINSRSVWPRVYYGIVIFSILIANLILASRAALLAMIASFAIALVLLLLFKFSKLFFLGLLFAGVIAAIGAGFFLKISRPEAVSSIVTSADSNTVSRFAAWDVSFKGIAQHPLLGVGLGNYELFFEKSRPSESANQIGVFDDAHNLFLQLAVTGGLPLVIIFVLIIALGAFYGLKELAREKNFLSIALLSSLGGWVVVVCFNPVPIPMYLVLALLLAGLFFSFSAEKEINFYRYKKLALSFFGWLLFAIGAVSIISEHLLGIAARAYSNQNYKAAYTLSSVAYNINPTNQLFLIYKTGSAIYLGKGSSEIAADVSKIERLHKSQASSFVAGSNLYDILFELTRHRSDLELAASNMQLALKLDPLYAQRYGQLAVYNYELSQNDAAKENLLTDLSFEQDDFSSWILLAKIYQEENNKAGVVSALTKAFYLNPNIPQLKILLYYAKNLPDVRQVPINVQDRPPEI